MSLRTFLTRAACAVALATFAAACADKEQPTAPKAAAAPAAAAAPFRRADGSYLFRSTFRWVVARRD